MTIKRNTSHHIFTNVNQSGTIGKAKSISWNNKINISI